MSELDFLWLVLKLAALHMLIGTLFFYHYNDPHYKRKGLWCVLNRPDSAIIAAAWPIGLPILIYITAQERKRRRDLIKYSRY